MPNSFPSLVALLLPTLLAAAVNVGTCAARAEPATIQSTTQSTTQAVSTLYYEKCAGCHGVDRAGRGGTELFMQLMRERGELSIKQTLHFGTVAGMPNWGTSESLSENDIEALARFLLSADAPAPLFDWEQVRGSWSPGVAPAQRLKSSQLDSSAEDLFVSLLHDDASLLFIDGPSKTVVHRAAAVVAPHALTRSPNGRYLYALGRGGELVMLDLFMRQPEVVARVRVGYEARAMAVVGQGRRARLLVASQAPAQLAVLDLETLEPLQLLALPQLTVLPADDPFNPLQQPLQPPQRIVQILAGAELGSRFMLMGDEPGDLYPGQVNRKGSVELELHLSAGEGLRPGVAAGFKGLAVLPGLAETVTLINMRRPEVLAQLSVPELQSPASGVVFKDSAGGVYWLSASAFAPDAVVLEVLRGRTPQLRRYRAFSLGSQGAVFVASHPASPNIWIDAAAALDPADGGSIRVVTKTELTDPRQPAVHVARLNVAAEIDLDGDPVRLIHPQYNREGTEVWMTAWNLQDRRSAVVVFDDASRTIKTVVEDPRLVTPIRTYALAGLSTSGQK